MKGVFGADLGYTRAVHMIVVWKPLASRPANNIKARVSPQRALTHHIGFRTMVATTLPSPRNHHDRPMSSFCEGDDDGKNEGRELSAAARIDLQRCARASGRTRTRRSSATTAGASSLSPMTGRSDLE